jgi:hypothetical protein
MIDSVLNETRVDLTLEADIYRSEADDSFFQAAFFAFPGK